MHVICLLFDSVSILFTLPVFIVGYEVGTALAALKSGCH